MRRHHTWKSLARHANTMLLMDHRLPSTLSNRILNSGLPDSIKPKSNSNPLGLVGVSWISFSNYNTRCLTCELPLLPPVQLCNSLENRISFTALLHVQEAKPLCHTPAGDFMEDAYSPLTPLTQETIVILIALTNSRIYLSPPHRLHCISVANLGTTTPCKSTAPCHVWGPLTRHLQPRLHLCLVTDSHL